MILQAQLPAALEQRFASAEQAYQGGDMDKAEKLYRALLKDYPKLPELYNNLAATLVAQGKSEQAIEVLQSGLRSNSSFASLYDNLLDINASMSRQHYMQALVPVKQQKPQLKTTQLSELGELYYAEAEKPVVVAQAAAPVAPAPQPPARAMAVAKEKREPVPSKLAQKHSESVADDVPPIMNLEAQVEAALLAWADAWSRQDVQAYVNAYVKGYHPDNMSHASWSKQRERRLKRPQWIKIKLSDMQFFILANGEVAVRLLQSYRSNTYRDVGRKELLMQLQDGQWKIKQEHSLQ